MKTWIALFRGINMAGKHLLPMKELVVLLEGLGASDVRTYRQSGNALFLHRGKAAASLAEKIGSTIKKQYGFEPWVLLLGVEELAQIMEENPFPEGVSEPELCVFFLSDAPERSKLDSLQTVRKDSERFALRGKVIYMHATEGIYRSKLAERITRSMGVSVTARTWSTIEKVMAMAKKV